ncbi:hypothetical protein PT250_00765 [Erysipelothrix rhusiopathiae]|uniref:hypothetical protein n=1 Tax=Erysipelothrix rhusiopathiae TaxID=1648 RepID=UPI000210B48C|nr:hypothetical protein [Erysipelothrix rhusiopathiae]AGN25261.1 hypothetical protein K210_08490 [Erysipelothrix rhusiopathiae SY1027]AMS11721.1 hypothetical protein A2I91_08225 [Erysipelothrix rhusiopathiae]AOO68221.1 hypothetical protein BC346_07745 [Erysipelothrix rhusiopathiae]AWU40930.1 hypothetical protein DM789_01365 [Erysipelothrix rhusiopathiae]MDE8033070.1 hypothetical protein [Erysipelothrix rhusiopathiae]
MKTFKRPLTRVLRSYLISVVIVGVFLSVLTLILDNQTRLDWASILGVYVSLGGVVSILCIYFIILKDSIRFEVDDTRVVSYQLFGIKKRFEFKEYRIKVEHRAMKLRFENMRTFKTEVINCRPLGHSVFMNLVDHLPHDT